MKFNKLDDFMLRVEKHPNGCWLWFGTRNKHGYGGYWAHRFSWERSKSKIPKGSEKMAQEFVGHATD